MNIGFNLFYCSKLLLFVVIYEMSIDINIERYNRVIVVYKKIFVEDLLVSIVMLRFEFQTFRDDAGGKVQ